jgi:TatD DNase family protein
MYIDTHAHLDMEEFDHDRDQVIQRALNLGINTIITIGIDHRSSLKGIELSKRYDSVYCSVGIHPHNADNTTMEEIEKVKQLASSPRVVGWGEIGLDFFKRYSSPQKQMEIFEHQLRIAGEHDLPVIIHCRDAHKETLEILRKHSPRIKRGVIHCFSGDAGLAMEYIRMGFFISIPGTVTYKGARKTQDVATQIPLESLLIETDAPFLSPVPKRGKRNEPCHIIYTAKKIAELRGTEAELIGEKTSGNAKRLFLI